MKKIYALLIVLSIIFVSNFSAQAQTIGWGNLQWPPSTTTDAGVPTDMIYGQAWINGVTNSAGATPDLIAQLGYGATSTPEGWTDWVTAVFNVDAGNNDEFMATLTPMWGGVYNYAYRYSYLSGPYTYCGVYGPLSATQPPAFGILTVDGPLPPEPTPEPTTMLLLGLGLAGLAGIRRKMQ